jgi:hypothetical protein
MHESSWQLHWLDEVPHTLLQAEVAVVVGVVGGVVVVLASLLAYASLAL